MRRNSFRHTLLTSSFTVPLTLLFSAVLWGVFSPLSLDTWVSWGLCVLMSGIILLYNQQLALMRHGSVMLLIVGMSIGLILSHYHTVDKVWLIALLYILSQGMLYRSYQNGASQNDVFQSFALVGAGSLLFPAFIFLTPLYWVVMMIYLRSFSIRNFFASILGLALPYWFYAAYLVWENRIGELVAHYDALLALGSSDVVMSASLQRQIGLLVALGVMSMWHYFRTNYKDKIRIRMCYYTLMLEEVALCTALFVWRDQWEAWLLLFAVNTIPLGAHYLALSQRSRITNYMLMLWALAFVVVWGLG